MKNFIRLFSIICLLIILSTCKKESKQNPQTDYIIYNNGEGSIGAGGGKIIVNDKYSPLNVVNINIPSGALETPTFISIKDITNEVPEIYVSNIPLVIEFLPDGLEFKKPVSLTIDVPNNISLDESSLIAPFDINSGYILLNESNINISERTITTEIEHFSIWAYVTTHKFSGVNYTYRLKNIPTNNCNFGPNFLQECEADIFRAFSKWQKYSIYAGITFSKTSTPSNIEIEFISALAAKDKHPLFNPLDYNKLVPSTGATLIDVTNGQRVIYLNDDYSWYPSVSLAKPTQCTYNIERLVNHEIGHNFGLSDYASGSVYFTNSVMGKTNHDVPLSICAIDLENLKANYPQIKNLTTYKTAIKVDGSIPIGSSNIGSPSQTLTNYFNLIIKDELGNGVPGVTVVFKLQNNAGINMGYISNPVVATDENGIATLTSLVLPNTIGSFTFSAKSWIGGSTQNPTREWFFNITTTNSGSVLTDVDGNTYKTVKIGTQIWMAENLKTTKYNDGTVITNVTDNTEWTGLTTGAYCDYGNIQSNSDTYGRLYNWLVAASTNPKNVCPTGWHVPSDTEWTTLENYLITNGYNYDGTTTGNKYAKSLAGTTFWDPSSIVGAVGNTDFPLYRNKSGFSALPGGDRTTSGDFEGVRLYGLFWSATACDDVSAWSRYLINSYSDVVRSVNSSYYTGFSIRCLKDN